MNKKIIPTIAFVICFFIMVTVINTFSVSAATYAQATQQTITPTPSGCVIPPSGCPTQPDFVSTYKEVLDNTQSSIENVQSTTTTVLWLVGAAFTLLTVEGFGSLWLTQKTTREVSKSSQEVSKSAQIIESTKKQALDVAQSLIKNNEDIVNVNKIYSDLKTRMEKIQSDLDRLDGLEEDIEWYKRLMSLYDMRNQVIRLGQTDEWRDATNNLSAQLLRVDSVAQLELIHTLQRWVDIEPHINPELDTRLGIILKSLIDSEPERFVKLEAERILQILQSRGHD
jgi:hypothetical protein